MASFCRQQRTRWGQHQKCPTTVQNSVGLGLGGWVVVEVKREMGRDSPMGDGAGWIRGGSRAEPVLGLFGLGW